MHVSQYCDNNGNLSSFDYFCNLVFKLQIQLFEENNKSPNFTKHFSVRVGNDKSRRLILHHCTRAPNIGLLAKLHIIQTPVH